MKPCTAFWLFLIVLYCVDTLVYLQGHNTMFWHYKTPNELEAQRKKLGLDNSPASAGGEQQ